MMMEMDAEAQAEDFTTSKVEIISDGDIAAERVNDMDGYESEVVEAEGSVHKRVLEYDPVLPDIYGEFNLPLPPPQPETMVESNIDEDARAVMQAAQEYYRMNSDRQTNLDRTESNLSESRDGDRTSRGGSVRDARSERDVDIGIVSREREVRPDREKSRIGERELDRERDLERENRYRDERAKSVNGNTNVNTTRDWVDRTSSISSSRSIAPALNHRGKVGGANLSPPHSSQPRISQPPQNSFARKRDDMQDSDRFVSNSAPISKRPKTSDSASNDHRSIGAVSHDGPSRRLDPAVTPYRRLSASVASKPKSPYEVAAKLVSALLPFPEKLSKAFDVAKTIISSKAQPLPTVSECIQLLRKIMIAACRNLRVKIAQEAYDSIYELRSNYELAVPDKIELCILFVAAGKTQDLRDICSPPPNVKLSLAPLSLSQVASIWQNSRVVVPALNPGTLRVLTGIFIDALKTPLAGGGAPSDAGNSLLHMSNEFYAKVLRDLCDAGCVDLVHLVLVKFNVVGQVPSRVSYLGTVAPRMGVPFKRPALVQLLAFLLEKRAVLDAFEVCKYMYDVGYAFDESGLFGVFKLALAGDDNAMVEEVFTMVKSLPTSVITNPQHFDDILIAAATHQKLSTAINIVEHMALSKQRPRSWASTLPTMRLASACDMLQRFVGVFNVFFTAEPLTNSDGTSGSSGGSVGTSHLDMNHTLISELVTNCVAHGMYTHAFWYLKYMIHGSISRNMTVYRSLLFALEQDAKNLKAEALPLWIDLKQNGYSAGSITSQELGCIFRALIMHGGLESKKMALEMYDSSSGDERAVLCSAVNPSLLIDFIFYFDRDDEGHMLVENLCNQDATWPSTLTENAALLIFQKFGESNRFDVLQLIIERLRSGGTMVPNRQLIRSLMGCLSTIRSNDPARIVLATQIYVWGVKAGTSGFIKTKEMFNLNIRLEECWCVLDVRLHLLRCLEWMHREVAKNQINGDVKVYLPPVITVLNNNPSGNATVKLKGHVLATCIKSEMKTWFEGRLDARMEADERDREKYYLVLSRASILEWMEYVFGPAFERESIFNAVVEIDDKRMEGGSLIFSKECELKLLCQDRKPVDDIRKVDHRRGPQDNAGRGSVPREASSNYSRGSGNPIDRDRRDERRPEDRDYRDRRDERVNLGNTFNTGRPFNANSSNGGSSNNFGKHFARDEFGRRRDDYGSGSGTSNLNSREVVAPVDDLVGSISGVGARSVYDEPGEYQTPRRRTVVDDGFSAPAVDYSYTGQYGDEHRQWKPRD
ncbi:hypothetical protein HDU81_009699 [Chytriomyces hyalinus]|nr:hypothetical protein HDU81_009699 [Chytriomyces hyalinus]